MGTVRFGLSIIAVCLAAGFACDSEAPDASGASGFGGSGGGAQSGGRSGGGEPEGGTMARAGSAGEGRSGGSSGAPPDDSASGASGAGGHGTSGDGPAAGTSGESGASGAGDRPSWEPIANVVEIVPDDSGFVAPEANAIGVRGNWVAENDCQSSPGDCTQDHVIGPQTMEVPFDTRPYPTRDGEVCLRGTTASVNAEDEYVAKWGARLVLPLNEGPDGERRPYDAAARGIGGFGVSVRLRGGSMVDSAIRVALLVDGVEHSHSRQFFGLTREDTFVAEFKRVKQGNEAEPLRVFDPRRITAIEITLPTRLGYELPFDLCVTSVIAVPASQYEPDLSDPHEVPAGTRLVPLVMDAEGNVLANDAGIQGGWYADNDCMTSPADCTADQTPAPGERFPIEDNRACTTGVVDPIGNSAEYATKWGAAIGLLLNRPEPGGAAAPFDAALHGVVGFAYKIRTYNIEPIRVEALAEGVAEPHFYETTQPVMQSMRFDYLRQGDWVTERVDLDTSQLTALRFHVPSASGVVRNFDFCVEELAAIVEDRP